MAPLKLFITLFILQALCISLPAAANSKLFREYIGSEFNAVKFTDVPINPDVEFHFILAFAIDYSNPSSSSHSPTNGKFNVFWDEDILAFAIDHSNPSSSSHSPTNGKFNVFWDEDTLTPAQVSSIKRRHSNVKVGLSLGGDTVGKAHAFFKPSSVDSWVSNAVTSLTKIIKQYHLDGIDVDYEHFSADPSTFAHCIGRLITTLKNNGVISYASIAPFDDDRVQSHYKALWKSYGGVIDYVNFQFYAYDKSTTVAQFLKYFDEQSSNYKGGKVLVSFLSKGSGGLSPTKGFFTACERLKSQKRLHGIFIWCADDSLANGFRYEKKSQSVLAN